MILRLKRWVTQILWDRFDLSITRASRQMALLARLLQQAKVSVVLDVGAHHGRFASSLRRMGFEARIVSFEPQTAAYSVLRSAAQHDPLWEAHQYAIGSETSDRTLWLSANEMSSSLLPMNARHVNAAPDSAYKGSEVVGVRTLDDVVADLAHPADRFCLKMDTQGYEMEVLKGAELILPRVDVVHAELLPVLLYENQVFMHEILQFLHLKNFVLADIEASFVDRQSGLTYGYDGIFVRDESA